MQHAILRKFLAVLFGVVLAATGLWASPAGEQEPAAAMEKEMVMDPTTGKMVTAPQYGGTITFALLADPASPDSFLSDHAALMIVGPVLEKLAWGIGQRPGINGTFRITSFQLTREGLWRKAGRYPTH